MTSFEPSKGAQPPHPGPVSEPVPKPVPQPPTSAAEALSSGLDKLMEETDALQSLAASRVDTKKVEGTIGKSHKAASDTLLVTSTLRVTSKQGDAASRLETAKGIGQIAQENLALGKKGQDVGLAKEVFAKRNYSARSVLQEIERIIGLIFKAYKVRTQTTLRSQEHMIGTGSITSYQMKKFSSLIEDSRSQINKEVLKKTKKEIDNASFCTLRYLKGKILNFFGLGHLLYPSWNARQIEKLKALEPGEALLYDAATGEGQHAMMMRVEKNKDATYTIYYANTGAGLHLSEFHEAVQVGNKKLYPTIFSMPNIPAEALEDGQFFEHLAMAADLGKVPPDIQKITLKTESGEDKASHGEKVDAIGNMYRVIKNLKEKYHLNIVIHRSDYSIEQYGASCVPSCIWRILSTIKTGEGKEQQLDIEKLRLLDSFDAMYERLGDIVSGRDASITAKLLLKEEIQSLKHKCQTLMPGYIGELEMIENNPDLDLKKVEMPISTKEQVTITSDGAKHSIELKRPKVTREGDALEATMEYQPLTDENGEEIKVHLKVVPDGKRWKGTTIFTNASLLADAVARGDKNDIDYYLKLVKEDKIFKGQTGSIASPPDFSSIAVTIFQIAGNMLHVDPSRNGKAQAKFLNDLALFLCEVTESKVSDSDIAKKFDEPYFNLQVPTILGEENRWVKALNALHGGTLEELIATASALKTILK